MDQYVVMFPADDEAAWEALDNVGQHDVVATNDGFRIDIDCRIDPTSRAGTATPNGAARPRGA